MAEKGAHITAVTQAKPSIFEILAQRQLAATVSPALKRICEVLASKNPSKFGILEKWFDEVYLCINAFMQYYYIKNHNASFSEAFYGLQRYSFSLGNFFPLNPKDKRLSFVSLVIIPYLINKIEKIIIEYKFQETTKVQANLVKLHSIMSACWESMVLLFYFKYLSGTSVFHSPTANTLKIGLQYAIPQDDKITMNDIWNKNSGWTWRNMSSKLFSSAILRIFEVSAFFLQFMQWWQSEKLHTNLMNLPVPTPPKVKPSHYTDICPICKGVRKMETVLPISGYVFCYRCIVRHLNEHGKCPVTNYPAKTNELVRVVRS